MGRGKLGNDRLFGDGGNDSCTVDSRGNIICETTTLANEIDAVRSSEHWTLGTNLDRLALTGTAANGAGHSLANSLTGNAAANTLNGGTGADTLLGGAWGWRTSPSARCWRKRPGRAGSTPIG
jgi:Ca2+-binding RTX toxin-like protein